MKQKERQKKVVTHLRLETVNRGMRLFLISHDETGYFAHEVGNSTKWAQVTGSIELEAHRLNPQVRYGNQYKRSWKPKPFKSISQAYSVAIQTAQTNISYH